MVRFYQPGARCSTKQDYKKMKHDFTVYLSLGIAALLLSTTRCSEPKNPKTVAVVVSVRAANTFDSILDAAIHKTALHAARFDERLAKAKPIKQTPEPLQWPTDHTLGKEYDNFIQNQ